MSDKKNTGLIKQCTPEKSDKELRLSCWMQLAQKEDSESYHKLLAELKTMLEKYTAQAVRRSNPYGDSSCARDIVQEVLLAVHAKRSTYDSTQRFLPWVYGITRHKIVDWQRKHFAEKKTLDFEFQIDDSVFAHEASPNSPFSDGLYLLLEKLHPRQREVIELTKIHGLSVAETAMHTGLTQANVKVLTHRGIVTLRKMMQKQTP